MVVVCGGGLCCWSPPHCRYAGQDKLHPQVHVGCLLATLSGFRTDAGGEFENLVASLSPHTHDADYEVLFRKGRELIEEASTPEDRKLIMGKLQVGPAPGLFDGDA